MKLFLISTPESDSFLPASPRPLLLRETGLTPFYRLVPYGLVLSMAEALGGLKPLFTCVYTPDIALNVVSYKY